MFRDPIRLHTGQKLGRYELLMPVARGGLGQVWAARLRGARGFNKLVAIKTLLPAPGDSREMEQRLLQDLRVAALIQHSNVAQTLELDEQSGTLYAVMEWVDGETLSQVIESAELSGGIPLLVAVNLIGQALRGLQAAHEHCDETGKRSPVVHRDVSPDNILISYSGIAKLVDFGIARAKRQDRTLGAENRIERNLGYAAPEQVRSEAVDPRTDLFAAGVTLYLLTTGRHPFQGKDSAATLRNILSDEPPTRPSVLKTSYSRTLEAVVMKALEKDPNRRWPSAEEMRLALERGVPQAFELGFEAQLRTFMADTVGDRGQKKREAIRRAEIVVDAGAGEPGGGTSKSSVKSLRAISVNTRAVRSEPEPAPTRRSMMPTLRPLLARSVPPPGMRKPLLIGTVAAVALVLGLVLLRTPSQSHNAASAPTVSMVDLNPPRPMAVPPALVQSAAANPTLPSAAAPPSSAPASRAKPLRKTAK
ncbi:MAG TPA: serine/threonine-protein kinase [Polyangiaceae bacterium]|nr:serine/threonine-protein kinase [Polyangiaceae bacterium]